MSQLGNAPHGCPRRRDGGDGPRRCELALCDWHLYKPAERGPGGTGKRVRLMVLSGDTCSKDVADRVKREGALLPYGRLGELLGVSRQAAQQMVKRAIAKARRARGRLCDKVL